MIRLAASFVLVLVLASPALAHKVNLFAHVEGEFVYVEGYFADGAPVADAQVEVFDRHDALIATGKSDNEGMFHFPATGPADYRVVMTASMGHRAETHVRALHPEVAEKLAQATPDGGAPVTLDETALRRLLSEELDARLTPLREEVTRLRREAENPRLTEILGGIGLIIGLSGGFLWGLSRRPNEGKS